VLSDLYNDIYSGRNFPQITQEFPMQIKIADSVVDLFIDDGVPHFEFEGEKFSNFPITIELSEVDIENVFGDFQNLMSVEFIDDATIAYANYLQKQHGPLASYEFLERFLEIQKTQMEIEINAIQVKFESENSEIIESLRTLKNDVNDSVLTEEKTIKGEKYTVSYVKGRSSWDGKKLDGYAAAHPEILQFKTTGNPSTRWTTK
jgi:hypothetical protein